MPFDDLRGFISALEKQGQLKRIRAEVDAELEITEITDRVSKRGGPALLFENVRGLRNAASHQRAGQPRANA